MIFQKCAKEYIDSNFHIENEPAEIVQNYTYLGTPFLQRVTFHWHKLKGKALHALFSFRKHTNLSKLSPFLANKIFDAMISPILTCSSEMWGVYQVLGQHPDRKNTSPIV